MTGAKPKTEAKPKVKPEVPAALAAAIEAGPASIGVAVGASFEVANPNVIVHPGKGWPKWGAPVALLLVGRDVWKAWREAGHADHVNELLAPGGEVRTIEVAPVNPLSAS